jgi:hypothetical protein
MRVFVCDQCDAILAIGPDGATGAGMAHGAPGGAVHRVPAPGVVDLPWHAADDAHDDVRAWLDAHPGATGADARAAFPMPDGWEPPTPPATPVEAPFDPLAGRLRATPPAAN